MRSYQVINNNQQKYKELKEQEEINRLRRKIANGLGQIDKDIRQAKTVRKKCEILFKLFESFNIPSKLEYTRYLYDESGELETAREQEQVWNALIQLLDEYVEIAGDEQISQIGRAHV